MLEYYLARQPRNTSALKGVNLGGWLLVERWMTPSLFENLAARNEYELSQDPVGRKRLLHHHKTFIQEPDWQWMSENGIELVRLPVGYWILSGETPYVQAKKRLDWAFAMAKKYNIRLLLDLHGAPGAQNDADHSGSGETRRGMRWLKSRNSQVQTVAVLEQLAKEYGHHPKLWGLQLLNEPTVGHFGLRLAWFYRRAYRSVVQCVRPGTYIVFSDGYKPWLLTNTFGWLAQRGYPPVIDIHLYHCFGAKNKAKTMRQHSTLIRWRARMLAMIGVQQKIIIGEWSAVLANQPSEEITREFFDQQHEIYDMTLAHCYWSYKTETNDVWNYRYMIENVVNH